MYAEVLSLSRKSAGPKPRGIHRSNSFNNSGISARRTAIKSDTFSS
jgi:hypothetical protein